MNNLTLRHGATLIAALAVTALAALLSAPVAFAQSATAAPPQSAASVAPKKIALISMVGDEFSIVVQRQGTGSSIIDNFKRTTVRVPGQVLNLSVLRGLDEAVSREFPDSERILLAMPHDNEPLPPKPQDRERVAFEKAVSAISKMKERSDWDQIVLVTPRWLYSERAGMASKLSGIGLYVQPLESAKLEDNEDGPSFMSELGLQLEQEVDTLKRGETARSQTYLAPFFYAVVSTLDAKTMRVIKREERYDFRKVTNPDSNAINIAKQFTPQQLAGVIDKFVQTAALRSVTEKKGSVEIGTLKDFRFEKPGEETKK